MNHGDLYDMMVTLVIALTSASVSLLITIVGFMCLVFLLRAGRHKVLEELEIQRNV